MSGFVVPGMVCSGLSALGVARCREPPSAQRTFMGGGTLRPPVCGWYPRLMSRATYAPCWPATCAVGGSGSPHMRVQSPRAITSLAPAVSAGGAERRRPLCRSRNAPAGNARGRAACARLGPPAQSSRRHHTQQLGPTYHLSATNWEHQQPLAPPITRRYGSTASLTAAGLAFLLSSAWAGMDDTRSRTSGRAALPRARGRAVRAAREERAVVIRQGRGLSGTPPRRGTSSRMQHVTPNAVRWRSSRVWGRPPAHTCGPEAQAVGHPLHLLCLLVHDLDLVALDLGSRRQQRRWRKSGPGRMVACASKHVVQLV